MKGTIKLAEAIEILDSRGNPTVRASVVLEDGSIGTASVPSGASTGEYEATELRDGDPSRYNGKGVLRAVRNVNTVISPAIAGRSAFNQREIDRKMIEIDNSENKSRLGANAMLAVSLAVARAAAVSSGEELFRYLGGIAANRLPVPMMNILNGGAHSNNGLDFQEFMIVPVGVEGFSEKLRCGAEIYHALGKILKDADLSSGVGDEGGYAPDIESEETAIELICSAIEKAGYSTDSVRIALDVASSEWESEGGYSLPKSRKKYDSASLGRRIAELCDKYPICSIEDPLGQNDWTGWRELTATLSRRVMLVGDDLFVTDTERLNRGIREEAGNSILIKPNQIGTLSETLDVMQTAASACYKRVVSHRSGETGDTFIADLAVATGASFIKTGAPCRGERTEKYNRLLEIESHFYC